MQAMHGMFDSMWEQRNQGVRLHTGCLCAAAASAGVAAVWATLQGNMCAHTSCDLQKLFHQLSLPTAEAEDE
jgi:2-methylcitrate dehydratase PrpD